jgi:hypothetical protein
MLKGDRTLDFPILLQEHFNFISFISRVACDTWGLVSAI